MTAIGRSAVSDPYLLRGLLFCTRCGRQLVPTHTGGGRAYSCGPVCEQPDVAAEVAEADLLLGALIRGAVTIHPDLGRTQSGDPGDPESWHQGPPVSAEEMTRWRRCDITDRRAVLIAAYTRVLVNAEGKLRPVWQHRADQPTTASV